MQQLVMFQNLWSYKELLTSMQSRATRSAHSHAERSMDIESTSGKACKGTSAGSGALGGDITRDFNLGIAQGHCEMLHQYTQILQEHTWRPVQTSSQWELGHVGLPVRRLRSWSSFTSFILQLECKLQMMYHPHTPSRRLMLEEHLYSMKLTNGKSVDSNL